MYRLAHATETTAAVWVRHTSGGVLTLTVNGQTFTGDTLDTAVRHGTGLVTATRLAPGQVYPMSLAVNGVTIHTGNLRTMPAAGSSFSMLWAYCWNPFRSAIPLEAAMRKHPDIAAFFLAGDNIYSDADTSTATRVAFGETHKNIGAIMQADPENLDAARAGLRTLYRAQWSEPRTRAAIEAIPSYPLISDHDMQTGDNWYADHSLAAANAYIVWATTQQEAIDVYEVHQEVFWDFFRGTPSNGHASKDPLYPDTEQFYYDFVVGDVHVFVLDAINHKDKTGSPVIDYGATQLAWLQSRLSASTSIWKMIATGEGITEYSATVTPDHQAIIDYCVNNDIHGAFMIAGDIHAPYYGEYGLPMLRGGQVSQDNHTAIPNGYLGDARYKWLGNNSDGVGNMVAPHACTVLRVTPERLDVDYLDSEGNVFWTKYMLPTDREMQHDRPRIG